MPFPLPLVPLEYYYWSDHRPDYPMVYPIDLRFSGELDRGAFEAALRQTIERHPMLGARIEDGSPMPRWVQDSPPAVHLDWAEADTPLVHPAGAWIDLAREPGLRTFVRVGHGASRVFMQMHHACCDGLAALQFLGDLLAYYAQGTGDPQSAAKLPPLCPEQLADRGRIGPPGAARPSLVVALRDVAVTLIEWTKYLTRRPAVVAPPMAGDGDAMPAAYDDRAGEPLALEGVFLSKETGDGLRQLAASLGVTQNDLMMRDLFLTIRDWNRARRGDARKVMVLNLPVNIRERDELAMPAANRIGFSFVLQKPARCDDPSGSLAAIHRQTERIKGWKLALFFLGGLSFACNVKGLVPWTMRRERSFATMVFSNLGRPFYNSPLPRRDGRLVCGNVVLDRFIAVPPIRRLTRGSLCIYEYGNELTVCLRCDPHYFSPRQTRALLESYAARLAETARGA